MSAQNKLSSMRKYFLAAAMVLSSAAVPQCATAGGKSAPVAFKATRMVNLTYPFFAVEGSPPKYKKWSAAEVKKILSVIAGSGFESVKLNVDPAPLLAEKNGLRDHLPEFESIIKEISGAHLSVIFDLQPQPLPEDQIQNL
ncbi:MAG TPA: hypothetical protein V6C72_09030, partial [Chroococcales cyanobacterium]